MKRMRRIRGGSEEEDKEVVPRSAGSEHIVECCLVVNAAIVRIHGRRKEKMLFLLP